MDYLIALQEEGSSCSGGISDQEAHVSSILFWDTMVPIIE